MLVSARVIDQFKKSAHPYKYLQALKPRILRTDITTLLDFKAEKGRFRLIDFNGVFLVHRVYESNNFIKRHERKSVEYQEN